MPSYIVPVLWGLVAYLAGSIIWGRIVARWYGVDIEAVDTRNPGAANVFRNVGRVQGIAVYLADLMTGAAVLIPTGWLPLPEVTRLVASIMILIGSFFPLFGGCKGGTGLAKGMGATMGINPAGFFLGVPLGFFMMWRTRNPAVTGGAVIVLAGLFSIFVYSDYAAAGTMVLVGALIFLRAQIQYRSP